MMYPAETVVTVKPVGNWFKTIYLAWKYRKTPQIRGMFVLCLDDGHSLRVPHVMNGCPQQRVLTLPPAQAGGYVSTYFRSDAGELCIGPNHFVPEGSVLSIELPRVESD